MTNLIVRVLSWLAEFITTNIPAITLDDNVLGFVSESIEFVLDIFAKTNWIFPVPDALLIIGIYFGFYGTKLVMFIVNWIIRRIVDAVP